jgi:hypothetical protein
MNYYIKKYLVLNQNNLIKLKVIIYLMLLIIKNYLPKTSKVIIKLMILNAVIKAWKFIVLINKIIINMEGKIIKLIKTYKLIKISTIINKLIINYQVLP